MGGMPGGLSGIPDVIGDKKDDREDDNAYEDDLPSHEGRSEDSEVQELKEKLGPLDDEDEQNDAIGDVLEITHDGKV